MSVDPSAVTEAGAGGEAAATLSPGATIGKYRLDRQLGAGGMGVVWAAFDPDLERPVAIKLLRSADSAAALRTRLLREARAMARLKHPNVLTVYEVGTDRNRDYIAMELIDGGDLVSWLATRPPKPEIYAALLASGRGLAAAHDAGLIHRDLKPHNILRGRDGGVYVTDFGLARGQIESAGEVVQVLAATALASGSHPRAVDSVLDSPLTQTGVLIGTPAYMAPEQFAGRAPDPRSDQFAFCVTAWEALTGARPFAGRTLEELRAAAFAGVGPAPGLLPAIQAVLLRGLSPDPAARWPDMRAVLRALEAALAPPRRSRAMWITLGAAGVLSFLAGVALYTRSHTAPQTVASASASASAGAECGPATEAFGSSWSSERRKAVITAHRGDTMLVAATAMIEEVRKQWIKQYQAACAMPAGAVRHERLACLYEVRDEVASVTQELARPGSEMSIAGIVPLNISVEGCKQD